ncbi:MAG: hypothetical protein LBS42_01250 [Tannerella sp.]|nr:hypothetical protein [Tannerella sp.]
MFLFGFMPAQAGIVTHNISSGNLTISGTSTDDYVISGTTTSYSIEIQKGYQGTITLDNVNIQRSSASTIRVRGEDECDNRNPVTKVKVILKGSNTLITTSGSLAAFAVEQGAMVSFSAIDPTDNSSGSLYCKSTSSGAAIGADYNDGSSAGAANGHATAYRADGSVYATNRLTSGGNIIISSGTFECDTRGGHGAGIGGGYTNYYNGIIVLYGGVISCSGGTHAAGIGTGCPNGSGNDGTYTQGSTIVAFPPCQITATTQQGGKKGLAGAYNTTYIGDPESPLITIYTEDYEKNATIYADLTETTSITTIFSALDIPYDLSTVKFGTTSATDGIYKINGTLVQSVTFFTDASSSQPATFGRPYLPKRVTVSAATNVILPLLSVGMSFEISPAIPMEPGYSSAQASANAYRLKITYTDSKPMTGVVYELQGGLASDFTGLNFFDADGTTPISAPATLSNGKVFYIQVPVKTGKAIGIYQDVLRFSGTWDSAPTGYIRQVVTQRIVKDDSSTNDNIRVTASPATLTTNSSSASVVLSLNISHSGLSLPYDPSDVTAKYLITTDPNYATAIAANPTSTWPNLNIPTSDGVTATTTAPFSGKPEGTYYIHWYVVSGVVFAHSLTVTGPPPATYGGFGPYIIDTTAPDVSLAVDGSASTKTISSNAGVPVTLTFNEAIKNPGTDLTASDFEITAGKATVGSIAVVPSSGDKNFTAVLTPSSTLYSGETFTVRLKAGAVTDVAGNSSPVSNTVTVTYSNATKPAVSFDVATAYSTLRPSFTVEAVPGDFASNGNTDLFQTAGGTAIISGTNLASLFTVTPEGGTALTSGYTATYTKSGTGASAKGIITFAFSVDLLNSTNYTVGLAANKLFNLLQNGNDAGSATFMIAEPDFTDIDAGISASPNMFSDEGGTTTLTIKGKGLKLNADAELLSLRVSCASTGYDSGPITSGFVVIGDRDQVTVPDVPVPSNTGSTTLTHTFTLYMTFNGPETSTGKTCAVQIEPAMSYIVTVVNNTTSVSDLTFGYSTGDAQLAGRRQNITVTNNGAQPLNSLTVSFAGPDGAHFANTAPSIVAGLAPGGTSTFYVYLQTGKNAGSYAGGPSGSETKVMVTATPASGSPLNGSAVLVQQKVVAAAGSGTEATVTGNPAPGLNVMTQNSVTLTASTLTAGDQLKDWKYAVVASNVRPADGDPAWTTAGAGTSTATHTFPDGTLGDYYVFYEINTNNYTGIRGQVEDSGVKVYRVDLVPPTVTGILPERTVTNATPFTVNVTFSEPVGDMDITKFVAANATVSGLTPVGTPVDGRYTEYQVSVTPNAGLVDDDIIIISVQAAAGKDVAGNPNTPSTTSIDGVVEFNSTNPLVSLTTPDLTVNGNFTVTATFTKQVSGLAESEINIINGAIQTGSLSPASGNGDVFTFVVNTAGSSSGIINISILENAVTDNAGNGNIDAELDVDYRDATDRIAGVLSYTGPTYENGPFTVNVSFSRTVTGLTAADFTYSTSDFAAPVLTGGGKNYVLALTPLVNKDNTTAISLNPPSSVLDEYGNTLDPSNTVSVNYDTRKPVVTRIDAVPAITEVHFDPFTVKITIDEETGTLNAGRLVLTGLTVVEMLGGPEVSGGFTEYLLSVKVAPNTPSNTYVTLALEEGAVYDKAANPNAAGAGITPLGGSPSGILFVDNIPPEIINVSVPTTNAPAVGDVAFTFDEPLDTSTPGTIWLEDFGYIPVEDIEWISSSTVNFEHAHLADETTYTVRIAGYLDEAGNVMAPRVFSFTTGVPAYPTILRQLTVLIDDRLTVSPAAITEDPFFVRSRDSFSFTVWPKPGYSLDSLTVSTGIPLRDSEGILTDKNADGSITVTLIYINEALNISVSLSGVAASETPEEVSNVWVSGRQLHVRTGSAAAVPVYTLSGGLYRMLSVDAGETVELLPPGYYTVVLGGKSYKVIVLR